MTPVIKYDDILVKIGGFGRYQIYVMFVWIVYYGGVGWQFAFTNFIVAKMDHWCRIPELEHLNSTMQKMLAIPSHEDQFGNVAYEKCVMYDLNYSTLSAIAGIGQALEENVNATRVPCKNGWMYDQSTFISTAFSQFDLVCENEWMYTLPASAFMLGMLVGAFMSGAIGDKFGRKKTTLVLLVVHIAAIIANALIPNFYAFVILRGIVGLSAIGTYTPLWVLFIEFMPHTHRSHSVVYTGLGRVLKCFLPLTAYCVRNHIHLQLISAAVIIPGLIMIIPLMESPRWLLSRHRLKEAEKITQTVAKINKAEAVGLNDQLLKNVDIEEEKSNASIIDLFRTPRLRRNTLLIWMIWLCHKFGTYALGLNIGTLIPGDIYLNMLLIIGISDVPEVFLTWFGLFKIGRRWGTVSFHVLNSLFIALMIPLVPIKSITWLVMVIALIGNMLQGSIGRVLYLYTGELFPTSARNLGLGSASSFGRIGGLLAPQVPLLAVVWYGLPYIVLLAFPLLAGILAIFLPETKGHRLPETFEQAEMFGTKQYSQHKKREDKIPNDDEDDVNL